MVSIFTKIISREIPASIIYEDEYTIAFLDISPFTKGHTLVVPKKEYQRFTDMPENQYCELQKIVLKLSKHYKTIFNSNIGSVIYGEDVPHVHIHIFPINNEIKVFNFSNTYTYEKNEMEEFKNRLKLNLKDYKYKFKKMVDFCSKCGALIMGKAGEDIKCSSCGHVEKATSEVTLSQKVEKKKELEVLGNEAETEVYPLTDTQCPKCGHDKAYFWSKQMRAGDEPETQFYKCEKCSHQWRDYM